MTEGEVEADSDGLLALLHELARDVVDRRDVIGIDRMPEAETIGEQSCAQEDRRIAKGDECPRPDSEIGDSEDGIEAENLALGIASIVTEGFPDECEHWFPRHGDRRKPDSMSGVMRGHERSPRTKGPSLAGWRNQSSSVRPARCARV